MKELKRPTPPVTFAYQLSYYNADHYLLSLQTPTDIPKAKKTKKRDLGPCKPVHNKRTLTMAGDIQQNAWKPTVRIGKIAAETTNPGPAIVQLPTLIGKGEKGRERKTPLRTVLFHILLTAGSKVPDSKKKAAPSYTLGSKLKSSDATTGPGPAQYNVSGMRPKGKDYPRAATLQSRPKELTAFVTPGPGEYNVNEAYKVAKDATPKYSIGKMPPPDKYQLIPGKSRRFHSCWCFWLALFEWLELESHWDSKCWSRIRCTYIYITMV